VIGMIEIFGSQSPTGGSNPAQLAQGISIALYNTAFGLIVAIPALMFYRYFRGRVDAYTSTWSRRPNRCCRTCCASPPRPRSAQPAPPSADRQRDELPPRPRRGAGDQPDPVHRRAAGDPDLPDAVDHVLQVHRAAGDLPVADAEKMRERPAEIIVACPPTAATRSTAIVSADATSAHQSVVNVLDAARRAGLARLTFAAQTGGDGAAR
jgi:hypothetical protein